MTDFQNYHNPSFFSQAKDSAHQRAFLPSHDERTKSTEHDADDHGYSDEDPSISGSVHHSSDDPDEAVFDVPSHHSSPQTSPQHSDDEISVLFSEPGYPNTEHEPLPSSPCTPVKARSPFRNPSSVRAMQLETTPPPHLTSPLSQRQYKLTTPSRNGTPRSLRSQHSAMRSASGLSPTKKLKKEYPLVLLHVTLLPIALSYSTEVLESVLPGYILENWKLLQEKATDTVLERGILIPHPKEDYDLLEERLLESLDLTLPRILKCGHFHLEPNEEADLAESDAEHFDDDDDDNDNDADICDDCGRRVRDGRLGSGTGNRRWDIKLYAANGLMRAGAWGAAWREMERVDVEILPWMDEEMKRELELRKEEEERHIMRQRLFQQQQEVIPSGVKSTGLDDERLREIYGEDAQAYVDGLASEEKIPFSAPPKRHRPRKPQQGSVPLWTLLGNYVYLAAQDRRNITIGLLSLLVLVLSLGSLRRPAHVPLSAYQVIPAPVAIGDVPDSHASIATAVKPSLSMSESYQAPTHTSSKLPSATMQSLSDSQPEPTPLIPDVPPAPTEDLGRPFTAESLDEERFEME